MAGEFEPVIHDRDESAVMAVEDHLAVAIDDMHGVPSPVSVRVWVFITSDGGGVPTSGRSVSTAIATRMTVSTASENIATTRRVGMSSRSRLCIAWASAS